MRDCGTQKTESETHLMADDMQNDILTLTTEIVSSYVGNAANLRAEEIPAIIRSVRAALMESEAPVPPSEPEAAKPTKYQINKSITPDGLVSFLDGKMYKTLKRHLSRHGHDAKSYKAAFGLPGDYPMVAPNYSAARSEMAKTIGLGAKGRGRPTVAKPAPKARKPKAAPVAPPEE